METYRNPATNIRTHHKEYRAVSFNAGNLFSGFDLRTPRGMACSLFPASLHAEAYRASASCSCIGVLGISKRIALLLYGRGSRLLGRTRLFASFNSPKWSL